MGRETQGGAGPAFMSARCLTGGSGSATSRPGASHQPFCSSDSKCRAINPEWECFGASSSGPGQCWHKHLLPRMDGSDFWMILLTFATIFLSVPVGVGGGGVLVSAFLVIGHFCPQGAIPLAPPAIFGGALSNNIINMLYRKHPNVDRPLVDYATAMMIAPYLLMSIGCGVLVNAVAPTWLITLLLVSFFFYVTYRTTKKALVLYRKEEDALIKNPERRSLLEQEAAQKPPLAKSAASQVGNHKVCGSILEGGAQEEVSKICEKESRMDYKAVLVVVGAWILTSGAAVVKGSGNAKGIVTCGSPEFWGALLVPLPLIGGVMWILGKQLTDLHQRKVDVGYEFASGDIAWKPENARMFAFYSIVAGFAVGFLGIAAGMILGPMLLELGMLPLVSVATTGFIVLFTSSSTAFQFWVSGQMIIDYALFLAAISFIAGASGNFVVNVLVKRSKRSWIVVAILAGVIGVTNVLTAVTGYMRTLEELTQGGSLFSFRDVCGVVPT